eukprot:GHUV01030702.1.p2 GENE.GHUV01030702.1~~GHUV01030702.1.p2  ORF type:complete len:101 (+),score=5.02 GHUV01030702.1:757-1059(+)
MSGSLCPHASCVLSYSVSCTCVVELITNERHRKAMDYLQQATELAAFTFTQPRLSCSGAVLPGHMWPSQDQHQLLPDSQACSADLARYMAHIAASRVPRS